MQLQTCTVYQMQLQTCTVSYWQLKARRQAQPSKAGDTNAEESDPHRMNLQEEGVHLQPSKQVVQMYQRGVREAEIGTG